MGYVELPEGNDLMAGMEQLDAGETVERGGVTFMCAADAGDAGCMLTVKRRSELDDVLVAMWTGGEVTIPEPPMPDLGHQTLVDLGVFVGTLFSGDGARLVTDPVADDDVAVTYEADLHRGEPNGRIVMSHTTHGGETRVNQLDVVVTAEAEPSDETNIYTGGADGGSPVTRSAMFGVASSWEDPQNEADTWTLDSADGTMDNPAAPESWDHRLALMKDQEGGRTVHVDLYSNFNENMQKAVSAATAGELGTAADEDTDTPALVVTPVAAVVSDPPAEEDRPFHFTFGTTAAEMDVPAFMTFDDPNYKSPGDLQPGEKQLIAEDGELAGTWKGIPGTFGCEDGVTAEADRCVVSHQAGKLAAQGSFSFTPAAGAMVIAMDMDWLAAGVWLTVPDDSAQGDYAGGAFVTGSDPFEVDGLSALTGMAEYEGNAFGRYVLGDTESDRFTASANLTANFEDEPNMISGELTDFMAGGESREWDLNLDSAEIPTTGRFNDEVSGHADGHNMDGVWAGQFFGNNLMILPDPAEDAEEGDMVMSPLPGSVAGTFAASDRDASDDYSLTLMGAFGADWTPPAE